MDTDEIKILLQKYKAGDASPQEKTLLENWYARESMFQMRNPEIEDYVRIKNEMWANMEQQLPVRKDAVKLWPRIAAVAAAVAMVVFGVWFFDYQDDPEMNSGQAVVVNDIAPGKNGATITLANGKVIQLSDAKTGVVIGDDKLAYNDGSAVGSLSASGGEMPEGQRGGSAVAKTAKGQTYEFTLPDGTKVWLNAASTLTIPSDFSGTESRKVALTGEAYFEVAKNKKRPFIVATAGGNGVPGQEVTVLGTHFNINAYNDEGSIKTTLLEGSVKVALLGNTTPASPSLLAKEGTILKPGQQSVTTGSDPIAVKEVDPESAVAWKHGDFNFKEEDLQTAMLKVARWYDVEVIYDQTAPKDLELGGWVSRKRNISAVLKMIESTGKVHFKVEGRRILVTK